MYGTIARLTLKPGTEDALKAQLKQYDGSKVRGYVGEYIYRADAGTNEYWLVVLFRDRESYHANAGSPEQDARYRKMRELLAADPEWHDGEVVHGRVT